MPVEFVDVEIEAVVFKRPKAVLVQVSETGEEKWIPRSQLHEFDEDNTGRQTIKVAEWFASKEGLYG